MESCNALPGAKNTSDSKSWIKHLSWTYCSKCKALITQQLLPNFFKRPPLKYSHQCLYKIPEVLQGLSQVEAIALQPLTIHLGDYCRKQNGY